ncbi:MAG TPA: hypothetical protein VMY36_04385 [Patescibacteria group bacterium]|nr:hypothetical protein [Patescibacteria group bacterium]
MERYKNQERSIRVRFEGDIQQEIVYGSEVLNSLKVGGSVNVGYPGEIGSVSCEIIEPIQEGDIFIARVESRSGRGHCQF